MFVAREPGELYLQGANDVGDTPRGWVERVDPITLQPLVRSPDLPAGGHTWCGAAIVTDRGDLLVVNGRWLHRLDPHTLAITAELELPTDAAHNGIVPLHDGTYATKDLRLDAPSTLVIVDHDLNEIARIETPEPSMGRIAVEQHRDRTDLYLPGDLHVLRYRWSRGRLEPDRTWRPGYREPGVGGLAWDSCLAGGRLWLLDNGSIPAVRHIHATHPTGTSSLPADLGDLWTEPLSVHGIALDDSDDRVTFQPFPDRASGWVIAPPTYEPDRGLLLVHDTGNARLAAYATDPVAHRWEIPLSMWMQPLLFPDTGELVVNHLGADGDHVVLVDVATGEIEDQIPTGADRPNGMFLTPGWDRDLYYATFDTVARIHVEAPR